MAGEQDPVSPNPEQPDPKQSDAKQTDTKQSEQSNPETLDPCAAVRCSEKCVVVEDDCGEPPCKQQAACVDGGMGKNLSFCQISRLEGVERMSAS